MSPFLTTRAEPVRVRPIRFHSLERRVESRPRAAERTVLRVWLTDVSE